MTMRPRAPLRVLSWLAFALGVAIASAAPAQQRQSGFAGDTVVLVGGDGEFFIAGLPVGWRAGRVETTDAGHHREWIPGDQSPETWTDMIAFQMFPSLAGMPTKQFLTQMAGHYAAYCDQVLATEIVDSGNTNGFDDAIQVLACTKNTQTSAGEVTMFRVVTGEKAFYVVQRAWRTAPFAIEQLPIDGAELDRAQSVVSYGHACWLANGSHPCPQGWDTVLGSLDAAQKSEVFQAAR